MENHPIPKDIKSFQFKLIGDMTIKQFGYLATGVVIAWIFYSLPVFAIIKYPLAFISAVMGFAFAFIPIDGRPMDVLLYHFFCSIFLTNQFIYQKVGGQLVMEMHVKKNPIAQNKSTTHSREDLRIFLKTLSQKPQSKLDEKEISFFKSIFSDSPSQNNIREIKQDESHNPEDENKNEPKEAGHTQEELLKEVTELEKQIDQAKTEELSLRDPAAAGQLHEKVKTLESELGALMIEKAQIEEKLAHLVQKMDAENIIEEKRKKEAAGEHLSRARLIPRSMAADSGLPIPPDFPNVILGIIKDSRGNVLPGILVDISNDQGASVRAFKTNQLGIFAAATPLQPGKYIINFEDPQGKQKLQSVETLVNNSILQPIEVISTDDREDLRKNLFEQNTI
ncbi:MAG: hypothetical protein EXS44_02580 [Candidatus Levybacteria bacterium]|nr:hypothetical protein [Candidatus Levybacteria bacterium]